MAKARPRLILHLLLLFLLGALAAFLGAAPPADRVGDAGLDDSDPRLALAGPGDAFQP